MNANGARWQRSWTARNTIFCPGGDLTMVLLGVALGWASLSAKAASPGKHVLLTGTYMSQNVPARLLELGHTSTNLGNIATVDFNAFSAIWLGLGAGGAAGRTTDLLNFVNRGGIVLVEAQSMTALTNSGLGAGLGVTNGTGNSVRIVDTGHPVNARLTADGLSGWNPSWWGYFVAVDGFSGLTDTGVYGRWVTIEKSMGQGHIIFTSQLLSYEFFTGAAVTNAEGIFLDNVLRLPPGTTTNAPSIVAHPQGQTLFTLQALTLSVTAYGASPLTYQWLKNGTEIAGATNHLLTIASLQVTNAGLYSAIARTGNGSQTSSAANLIVLPRPDCVPVPEGLISWWRMENDLNDNWGPHNPSVTPSRGVSFFPGKVGQALGGNSVQDGYFAVVDTPALRFTNALSIEAWVFTSALSGANAGARTIVSKYDPPFANTVSRETNSSFFFGTTNNGRLLFAVSPNGSSRTNIGVISPTALTTNQWHFVVATYDGSSLRVYLNGDLVAQTNYAGGIFPGTANLGVGASSPNDSIVGWTWNGALDEVSLYNRALLPAEIAAIYQAEVTGKCLAPPTIVQPPRSQAVPEGEELFLSVLASGIRPFRYQWQLNGSKLIGATNSTLVVEKLTVKGIGNYSVLVSNALGFILSSNAVVTLLPAPTCVDAPAGGISWWPGDVSVADALGTNGLTLVSPATYGIGKVGSAFRFNGLSSQFRVNSSAALNFGSNADFSIEAWIKALPPPAQAPSSASNLNVPILEKRTGTAFTSGIGYSLSLNKGRLAFWLAASGSTPTNPALFVSNSEDLRDNRFHHVALTLNRNLTNGGRLYVDGQVVLTFDAFSRRGSLVNSGPLLIGSPSSTVSNSFFNGFIDEPAIYNRALTTAEVQSIRSAGAAGKCKVKPLIIAQPISQKVTIGSNATFSVAVTGTGLLRYQWRRGEVNLFGATNSTFSFVVQTASGGNYSVRVTNAFGAVISSNALLVVNHIPIAIAQSLLTDEDTPVNLVLRGSDANADPLTFSIVEPPAKGQLSGVPPNLSYTPATNHNGPDSFKFRVSDGMVSSAPALVSIQVRPVNDAPIASGQSLSVDEDNPLAIALSATDPDAKATLSFKILTAPAHGTLSGVPPALSYLPGTNYYGADEFVFQASDGFLDSQRATVVITVNPINDAPYAVARISPLFALSPEETNQFILSLNNSNGAVVLDGSASFDVENDPLSYSWFEASDLLGSGMVTTNLFAIGQHTLTLQVSDAASSGTESVVFEVLTAAGSIDMLVLRLEQSGLTRRELQPLLASLQAAARSCERGAFETGVNQLSAFQNKVRAQVAPENPALAARLDAAAGEIIEALRP